MNRVTLVCSFMSGAMGALLAVTLAAHLSSANAQVDPQRLVVRELVLIDDEGRQRVVLGDGRLTIFDPNPETPRTMAIGQLADDTFGFFTPNGSISHQTRPGRQSFLLMTAPQSGLVSLGAGTFDSPDDPPALRLIDRTGRRIEMGFDGERRPTLRMQEADGTTIWTAP